MQSTAIAIEQIPPLTHEEAMQLAQAEYQRLIELIDQLTPEDFARPTDCTGWDVAAVLSHVLGMLEHNADPAEQARQSAAAGQRAATTGETWIDALTALQVAKHAELTPRTAGHSYTHRGTALARPASSNDARATRRVVQPGTAKR